MSPEQALGKTSEVGGPSDIYSLGVVLYQMLTGELPFRGTARMLFHQVLHEDPRPPRSLDRGIPRDLDTICLKAMEKLPARRYSIAQELASDLRHFLNGEATKARPMSILERCWRRCRRNPGPVAALFGVVCAVIIAVLLLAIRAQGNVEEMPEGANQLSVLPHLLRAGGIPVVAIASTGMGLTLSVAINLCLSNNRRVFLVHVVLSMIPIILALVGTLYGYSLFLRLATSPASPKPFEIAIAMASTAAFAIIGIVPAVCAAILGLAGLTLKSGAANE